MHQGTSGSEESHTAAIKHSRHETIRWDNGKMALSAMYAIV